MSAERLMIGSTFHPVEVGQETARVPLHMTVVPWFTLDSDAWPAFDAYVRDEIMPDNPAGPFPHAWVGERKFFTGDEGQEIAVTRVHILAMDGLFVYGALRQLVRDMAPRDGRPDESYAGMNWAPHVSDAEELGLEVDQVLRFNNVTVFEKLPTRQKRVKAVYKWGNFA